MDFREAAGNAVRFATIGSFKGLEADVVFLIGLKEGKQTCTGADIYVGGSWARFLLYVFHNKAEPPKTMPGTSGSGW
jgi:superfamily I DNA/RNA helicase